MVERGGDEARAVAGAVHPLLRGAHLVGITGSPGAGKSTLTSALCSELRARDERVAVLAIDPSSPFTGGAILGDRVRMGDHALDDGVFIRSMATRGHLGGLSVATPEAARVLDAAGYDRVIVETVGVGQVEVEVAGAADTTVVVVNPGWGDAVQAAKAGLMEIADLFVINKADRPGAGEARRDLEGMLAMASLSAWQPPVIDTVAMTGEGVEELAGQLEHHRCWLVDSGVGVRRRAERAERALRSVVVARLAERAEHLCTGAAWAAALQSVTSGGTDPWSAAEGLLRDGFR
jgi:LAO/AO transport system kinase